jgi:predicted hydrocarbon binding protein
VTYRLTALPPYLFVMTAPTSTGLRLGRRVIHQLRASLERDAGLQAATHLQEAGFAGGEELYKSFTAWLSQIHGVDRPADLDAQKLGEVLSEFLSEQGWGRLDTLQLGPAVLALDSTNWAEALDEPQGEYPSCHLSCGLLADFLGRVSQGLVAVMEVECRTRGEPKCRFLAGAPETLGILYERMAQGSGYLEALAGDGKQ